MKKILIGFASGLLIVLITSLVGIFLLNQIYPSTKDITGLKPITYETGQDALMGDYQILTINAINEKYDKCVVMYKVCNLAGGASISITNDLGERYTAEELLSLRIETTKAYYITFKQFEDNALSNIKKSFNLLLNLIEFELNFGEGPSHSINATNIFTACSESGVQLTNYSITFDIQEKGATSKV